MRLGITLRPSGGFNHAIDDAVAAEAAGFQCIYVGERHFDSTGGFANPFAVAAAISGRVQHARLGVIPSIGMEHPLRLIEQANMLELLTRGRSLMVLSDAFEPSQYAAFGLPVPRNGLFDDLVQRLDEAWSWNYQEDGPALEFHSGAYSAKMAGRIMPQASPRRAIETATASGARDAARKGWLVHLRADNLEQARELAATYRETLTSSGDSARTVEDGLNGLALVMDEGCHWTPADLEGLGLAEVRLDFPVEAALRVMR